MNATGFSVLINPHPRGHIVYPYTDELRVTEAVGLFSRAGLEKDEAVVLIMSKDHCEPLRRRLIEDGFDLPALEESGQLTCIDAESCLSRFMIDGAPEPSLFKNVVARIVYGAETSGGFGRKRTVRLFGEMVSLLCNAGNVAAAEQLEHLWNDVIETYSVSVLCTYSLCGDARLPRPLIDAHSCELHSNG